MKIGFDVAQTCVDKAGCGWYADSLVRALASIAPEHHFFLYHQFGDWINESTAQGTRIDALNVTPTFTDVTSKEASRIWQSPDELLVKTGAPDIVHANSFRAPRIPGAKMVFTVYDVSFWAVPHFTTEKNRLACQKGLLQALGNADGFIFISQNAHDEFERMLPGWLEENACPWRVTPLAARPSFIKAPGAFLQQSSGPFWLSVGSLEPRKNYGALLSGLEMYWEKSAAPQPLWLAGGEGWNSLDLARRIEKLSGKGMVRRLGYVSDDELSSLYSKAISLIFPSWYEGFGLPVLEAMGFGCPVICSSNTSLAEVGGNAPIYINPEDPASITTAMLQIETDRKERDLRRSLSLGQASHFSWEQTARTTLAFYGELYQNKRRTHP